ALAIIDPMAQEQGTPQASSVSVLGPRCHCSCPPTKRSLRAPKGQKAIFCRTSPGADLILRQLVASSEPANMQAFQAAQTDVAVPFNGVGDKSETGKSL